MPPWQGPDEPSHFALAELLTVPDGDREGARPRFEEQILQSMFRHHWWELYRVPPPRDVPRSFGEVLGGIPPSTLLQPTYYWLAAMVLRMAPVSGIDGQYRVLRALSILLSLLTLLCGWAGARRFFGDAAAAGVVGLASLNPQFLLGAISVNPDVLINLCGAFIWWQAACLLQPDARRPAIRVALVLAAAGVAAFAKRNGLPLLLTSTVLAILTFVKSIRHRPRPWLIAGVASGLMGAGMLLFVVLEQMDVGVRKVLTFWSYMLIVRRSVADIDLGGIAAFVARAVDTSWLVAGWMRFPAPDAWLWIARLFTAAGLIGAVTVAARSGPLRRPLALAWLFLGVQGIALLAIAFMGASPPQGRYVFSALIPAAALLWFGLHECLPAHVRPYAGPVIVGIVALLDATGFATVLLPTYLPYQAY